MVLRMRMQFNVSTKAAALCRVKIYPKAKRQQRNPWRRGSRRNFGIRGLAAALTCNLLLHSNRHRLTSRIQLLM